jgi:proline dehydrogenase
MVVFSIFSYNGIISRSHQLVKLARGVLGLRVFSKLMKMTVYGQFVAGENLEAIYPVIERYKRSGVRAILDYAVEEDIPDAKEIVLETRRKTEGQMHLPVGPCDSEHFPQFKPTVTHADTTVKASARTYFYATERKCDDVMKNFISCVNMAADITEMGDAAFAAIKLTGLGRVEFLLKLSEVVEGTRRLFLDLADSPDICTAQITPQSFHDGLKANNVRLSESQTDQLYSEIDTETKKRISIYDWVNRFQPGNDLYRYFQAQKGFCTLAMMEPHDLEQMQSVVQRAHTVAEVYILCCSIAMIYARGGRTWSCNNSNERGEECMTTDLRHNL